MYYSYDEQDNLIGFKLNGIQYYYVRNGQGDITEILDSTYTTVVSYIYDTWGRLILIRDGAGTDVTSNMTHIGNLNPYRYDNETGLFYLNSRYYNPEMGRFINADSVDVLNIDQDSLVENNLFAYCLNNPVKMVDMDGKVAQIAVIIGVTALLIFTVPDFYRAMKNPNSKNIFWAGLGVIPVAKIGKIAAPVKK